MSTFPGHASYRVAASPTGIDNHVHAPKGQKRHFSFPGRSGRLRLRAPSSSASTRHATFLHCSPPLPLTLANCLPLAVYPRQASAFPARHASIRGTRRAMANDYGMFPAELRRGPRLLLKHPSKRWLTRARRGIRAWFTLWRTHGCPLTPVARGPTLRASTTGPKVVLLGHFASAALVDQRVQVTCHYGTVVCGMSGPLCRFPGTVAFCLSLQSVRSPLIATVYRLPLTADHFFCPSSSTCAVDQVHPSSSTQRLLIAGTTLFTLSLFILPPLNLSHGRPTTTTTTTTTFPASSHTLSPIVYTSLHFTSSSPK